MELNQERIEAGVIAEVSAKMLGEDELYSRAKAAIIAKVDALWKETAEQRIREQVEAAIKAGFEHEYQRIDTFGQPRGDKTTIKAELERLIGGYWNAIVDKQGNPSAGYGEKLTRAEWMMAKLCAADFQKEMQQHVANIGGSLKDSLRLQLHETVNRLLGEIFQVRSLDDQGKDRGDNKFSGSKQTELVG